MDFASWFGLPRGVGFAIGISFWIGFDVACVILMVKIAFWRLARYRQKLARSGLGEVDRMSGEEFERFLEVLFERIGYEVETTSKYDKGADLLITRDSLRTAVQAKRWKQQVGVDAIRAVVASLRPYRCTHGMVVTNSTFTRPARQAAKDNNIDLWDRTDLANVLLMANNPGRPLPLPGMVAWLFSEPRQVIDGPIQAIHLEMNFTCTTCGVEVSRRVREFCLDQPRRFEGKVYCMEHQRQFPTIREREMRAAAD